MTSTDDTNKVPSTIEAATAVGSTNDDDEAAAATTAAESTSSSSAGLCLLSDAPLFCDVLHQEYIFALTHRLDQPSSLEGALTEHLKASGVYWALTALALVSKQPWSVVDARLQITTTIVEWVWTCFDEASGGFGGNSGQDGHLLYTLSALQILALADRLDDPRLQRDRVVAFVVALQQPDGSWTGDRWGEVDTRFTYCALSSLALLQALDRAQVDQAAEYVLQCRNLDGGFGCVVGAESHAGQVFCCVGALAIAKALDKLTLADVDLLGWWLSERQVDSGGLNGRPEKQADVCYSWWILSALSILQKVDWINGDQLAKYILNCQDDEDGGIADRPDDMADVFHTFFGIAGLSLLGHLHTTPTQFRSIDPVYALPTDIVQALQLPGQVVQETGQPLDPRLAHYDTCAFE